MPNVVRHVERSGYPQVVSLAVQALKHFFALSPATAAESFNKWQGCQRVVASLGHKTPEVRVALLVLLGQLAKDARWHDTIAVTKGYRELVLLLESEDEREQIAAHVVLRVLLQKESNVSDFARAAGFAALFRLLRGQAKATPKVLAQTMGVLRLAAANRTVAVEIKSAGFEMDVAKHLGAADDKLQAATLDALEAILSDDAGQKLSKHNGKLQGALTAFVDLSPSASLQIQAKGLLQKLAQ